VGTGDLSSAVMHLGLGFDHSTPSTAEVKNEWNYSLLPPYAFVAWTGTKLRDYNHPRTSRNAHSLGNITNRPNTWNLPHLSAMNSYPQADIGTKEYVIDISILKYNVKNKYGTCNINMCCWPVRIQFIDLSLFLPYVLICVQTFGIDLMVTSSMQQCNTQKQNAVPLVGSILACI